MLEWILGEVLIFIFSDSEALVETSGRHVRHGWGWWLWRGLILLIWLAWWLLWCVLAFGSLNLINHNAQQGHSLGGLIFLAFILWGFFLFVSYRTWRIVRLVLAQIKSTKTNQRA